MEPLFFFGDALKALDDNGKIGGYLIRFCDDGTKKDLANEYFTSKTYLGAREGDGVDVMFHHGQPLPYKAGLKASVKKELIALQDKPLGVVKTSRDAVGIFAETVLDMANTYQAEIYKLVKAEKLGWSSGAVAHLVKKSSDGQITCWPIGEASITPTPCEPLNRTVTLKVIESIKFVDLDEEDIDSPPAITDKPVGLAAKLNQLIDDLADDKGKDRTSIVAAMAREAGIETKSAEAILTGQDRPTDARLKAFARVLDVSFDVLKSHRAGGELRSIKGMFADLMAEQMPSRWELESTYCRGVKLLANAAVAAQMADIEFDLPAKMQELTNEYTSILQSHALSQIQTWMSEGDGEEFYLKSVIDTDGSIKALAESDIDSHTQLAVSALSDLVGRFRGVHEGKIKAGRVMSDKYRQRIASLSAVNKQMGAELDRIHEETKPKASQKEQSAAISRHLQRKRQQRELIGV